MKSRVMVRGYSSSTMTSPGSPNFDSLLTWCHICLDLTNTCGKAKGFSQCDPGSCMAQTSSTLTFDRDLITKNYNNHVKFLYLFLKPSICIFLKKYSFCDLINRVNIVVFSCFFSALFNLCTRFIL